MLRTSILVACFLFFLFGDKLIILVETIWKNLSSKIYEPTDSSDPFTDFASLDETIIDVITETKIKFEDVAGNEEAKDELMKTLEEEYEEDVVSSDQTRIYLSQNIFDRWRDTFHLRVSPASPPPLLKKTPTSKLCSAALAL